MLWKREEVLFVRHLALGAFQAFQILGVTAWWKTKGTVTVSKCFLMMKQQRLKAEAWLVNWMTPKSSNRAWAFEVGQQRINHHCLFAWCYRKIWRWKLNVFWGQRQLEKMLHPTQSRFSCNGAPTWVRRVRCRTLVATHSRGGKYLNLQIRVWLQESPLWSLILKRGWALSSHLSISFALKCSV